jgi:CO/xanthine dehydrogenase FAD-binding subunit
MHPAPFEYEVAESVDHAIELLGQYGEDARPLAGGHSLIPLMRLRLATPTALIDLGKLDDLRYIREDGDHLAIGALTRHREIHFNELVNEHCGILSYTAGLLGDPSVQHRGTIGGVLAHGDPAGDMPSVMCALEGEIVIQGRAATRSRRRPTLPTRAPVPAQTMQPRLSFGGTWPGCGRGEPSRKPWAVEQRQWTPGGLTPRRFLFLRASREA